MKRAVEATLLPLAGLLERYSNDRRETLILAYHNIVPHGCRVAGESSLHLMQQLFAAQLDLLEKTHQVIPLEAVRESPLGKKARIVITFDDGYAGAFTAGIEELDRRHLPATFFITPGLLPGRTFWWDEVAAGGQVASELRRYAIDDMQGRGELVRNALQLTESRSVLPQHARTIGYSGLVSAATVPGISFASHTWSHVNLARVSDDEVVRELMESRRWLTERFRNICDWVSFPYGRSSDRCNDLARACGYSGALRIEGGWISGARRGAFVMPRLNVPSGVSISGFRLRTSGLLVS